MFIALMTSFSAFAQKKVPKLPPPVKEAPPSTPVKKVEMYKEPEESCFVYSIKEEKEGKIFVIEKLLEYGWNNALARMVITTYNYDPVAQKKAKEVGDVLAYPKQLQFINGAFKIDKNIYTFTPDKLDKFQAETFKILFVGKTKNIKNLTDSKNEVFEKSSCLEPIVGK